MFIPKHFIKSCVLTNVKNQDGSLVEWYVNKSYGEIKSNYLYFQHCDKKQTVRTYIKLILINGRELTTIHDREVLVE